MNKKRTTRKQASEVLSVLGYEGVEERGLFERRVVPGVIDVEKLGDEVKAFMGAMEKVIGKLSGRVADYDLETISVTAEVSAKGRLSLLGSGGEVGGKGGLTFTFRRSGAAKPNG